MVVTSSKGKYSAPEGSPAWEYITAACCTILVVCTGTVAGWTSPSLAKLMAPDSPIPVSSSEASTMSALLSLGQMVAPPLAAVMVDKMGRKNTLLIAGAPLVIGWGMITVAQNVMVLFIARFISGLSLGLELCVCPMYLGEIASAKSRGALGMVLGVMFNIGILFTFIVGAYLSVAMMALICMSFTVAFMASFWFMPKSPYFLAMIGKTEEAEGVLEKLRGKTDVSDELESITNGLKNQANNQKLPFKELFAVRGNRKAFFIILLFVMFHHFGGFVSVILYGQIIFKQIGNSIPDHLATVIVAIVQLVSTILTTFVVDRLGRKPLIFFSGLISGLCCGTIGGFFYATEHMNMDLSKYALVPFIAVLGLVFAFNCGLVPLKTVLMSEVFPTSVKALAGCILGMTSGLFGAFGGKMYLVVASTWGYGHSTPFIAFCFITWLITFVLLWITPETKGKTLMQIQKDLNE